MTQSNYFRDYYHFYISLVCPSTFILQILAVKAYKTSLFLVNKNCTLSVRSLNIYILDNLYATFPPCLVVGVQGHEALSCEECSVLGYDIVYSGRSLTTLQRNVLLPSWGLKIMLALWYWRQTQCIPLKHW